MSVSVRFYSLPDPSSGQSEIDIWYEMGAVPPVGASIELDGVAVTAKAVDWVVDPDMYRRGTNGEIHILVDLDARRTEEE